MTVDEADGTVLAILIDGESVDALGTDQTGVVILDCTPFYGESGGQVGDCGHLSSATATADVTDTTKAQGHHLHHLDRDSRDAHCWRSGSREH
jgi:alanyl-tRNA synthetase